MTTHPLFRRVAVAAIALSLGVMAGFLVAVRRINPALEIHVGPLAIAAGIVAAVAAGWVADGVFRALALPAGGGVPRLRQFTRRGLLVMGAVLAVFFAWSIKDVSPAKQREMVIGTSLALVALGGALFFFLQVVRYLERDEARTEKTLVNPPEER
ncbi:MAG TPA: hypothetical protein PKE47_07010 [Verrucomicrobiota bacterium]|nr:hypothetical protein [Verrucomicrobiota bacterium]